MNWYLIEAEYQSVKGSNLSYSFSVKAKSKEAANARGKEIVAGQRGYKKMICEPIVKLQHPVDSEIRESTDELIDERIFSGNDMFDFAYRIAQHAQQTGLRAARLHMYILDQLDQEEGN